MYLINTLTLAIFGASSVTAFDTLPLRDVISLFPRKAPGCPAIWNTISTDLTSSFIAGGQCTDMARAAIRYAFHDAGTFSLNLPFAAPAGGGADGSLLLNADEIKRGENGGLGDYNVFIGNLWNKYKSNGVGAADLIYFAGNHAVVTCPGGPQVRTVIGRTDSSVASPTGVMPPGFGPGSDHDSLLKLFQDKGFSAEDLAALIGAHSTSRNVSPQPNIPKNDPQDSTPGVWDVKYYSETYNPPAGVSRFDSDINLSNVSTAVGKKFQGFVNNQNKWTGKFADAMYRLSVLGIPASTSKNFIDCTSALPKAVSVKREAVSISMKRSPIMDRAV